MISATRYHPNGEVALELSYNDKGNALYIYHKSSEKTDEQFPDCNLKNTWTAKRRPGSIPHEYDYFDKDGKHLSVSNKNKKALEKLKEGPDDETAIQALQRFNKVVELVKKSEDIDPELAEEIAPYTSENTEKVTEAELQKCEEKFGVTLPPSYRNFVLKYGLIDTDEESGMLPVMDFEVLSKHLKEWDIDVTEDFSEKAAKKTDRMFVFYAGPNDDTECFDFNTQNRRTKEVTLFTINHEEINNFEDYYFNYGLGDTCEGSGFDSFMSRLMDSKIDFLLDEIEEF